MRARINEKCSFLVRYKRHSRSDADKEKQGNGKVLFS